MVEYGIAGRAGVRQRDMVGQGQVVEAQCLSQLRDVRHDLGRRHRAADRQVEADLHLFPLRVWLSSRLPRRLRVSQ